ncbi:MAG: acyltransferase [Pseudomonadota bacterium]
MHPRARQDVLHSVQILRIIAALAVAWFHIEPTFAPVLGTSAVQKLLTTGSAGVDIFFVISGFIIWTSTTAETNPADFLYRRAARIYTALWPAVLIFAAAVLVLGLNLPSGASFLRSLILIDVNPTAAGHGLYVTWSLTYELVFYAGFAGVLFAGRQWAPLVAMVAISVVLLARYAEASSIAEVPVLFTDLRWFEFLGGCLVAHLCQKGVPRWLQAGSVLLGLVFFAIGIFQKGWFGQTHYVLFFGGGAMLLLLAVPTLETLLRNPVGARLAHMGNWSYGLYLLHPTVILFMGIANLWSGLPAPLFFLLSFIVYTALCLAVSALYFTYVEEPLLRRSKAFRRRLQTRSLVRPA